MCPAFEALSSPHAEQREGESPREIHESVWTGFSYTFAVFSYFNVQKLLCNSILIEGSPRLMESSRLLILRDENEQSVLSGAMLTKLWIVNPSCSCQGLRVGRRGQNQSESGHILLFLFAHKATRVSSYVTKRRSPLWILRNRNSTVRVWWRKQRATNIGFWPHRFHRAMKSADYLQNYRQIRYKITWLNCWRAIKIIYEYAILKF